MQLQGLRLDLKMYAIPPFPNLKKKFFWGGGACHQTLPLPLSPEKALACRFVFLGVTFEDLDVSSAWGRDLYGMHAPLSVAKIYLMTFDKCAI